MKKLWLYLPLFLCFSGLVYSANPLPAADVFQANATRIDANTFVINWSIKPGYFLYHDRIKLLKKPHSIIQTSSLRFPSAIEKIDSQGHHFSIYRNYLSLPIAILGKSSGEEILSLEAQGCADDGFCYPPQVLQIKILMNKHLELVNARLEEPSSLIKTQPSSGSLSNRYSLSIILSFFGLGLLLSFTPCILPMIPVLSGIIAGHAATISTRKAFFLSLSYVLSMCLTYSLTGISIALLGSNFQLLMQSPWIISLFSLVFIVLAFSMFGYYQLRLPTTWQAKLAGITYNQKAGHYLSAALMGALSTLILSPCVTAPLVGVLTYIAQTGSVVIGGLALFSLSLGMGTPLLLIGTSAGKWLPKAGSWMNTVQTFFGVLMLGMAIFLLKRILPASLTMFLWASLAIFSGVYCGALSKTVSNRDKLGQGIGLILLAYGILILIGASMGSNNPLQPLTPQVLPSNNKILEVTVTTPFELKQALTQAQGKPIIVDFYADWCMTCQILEMSLFKQPAIKEQLNHILLLKVDVTQNESPQKELLKQFAVIAPPTFIFLKASDHSIAPERIVGEVSAADFLEWIKKN